MRNKNNNLYIKQMQVFYKLIIINSNKLKYKIYYMIFKEKQ